VIAADRDRENLYGNVFRTKESPLRKTLPYRQYWEQNASLAYGGVFCTEEFSAEKTDLQRPLCTTVFRMENSWRTPNTLTKNTLYKTLLTQELPGQKIRTFENRIADLARLSEIFDPNQMKHMP